MADVITQHDLDTEARLTRIESKVDSLKEVIDEALLTQLKDHSKRIATLEQRQIYLLGWMAGAGAVGAALGKFFL